jgi:hypothetical protein
LEGLVDYAFVDKLNLKKGTWERLEPFMARNYPKLLELYRGLYHGDKDLWSDITIKVSELANKYNVKARLVF